MCVVNEYCVHVYTVPDCFNVLESNEERDISEGLLDALTCP